MGPRKTRSALKALMAVRGSRRTNPLRILSIILHPSFSVARSHGGGGFPASASGHDPVGMINSPSIDAITAPIEKKTDSPVRRNCERVGMFSSTIAPSVGMEP